RREGESALAVAQCYRDVVVVGISGDQVQRAVPIYVRQSEAVRVRVLPLLHEEWGTRRRLEAALAVSKQDADRVTVVIGEGQIQVAVAVDVPQSYLPQTMRELNGRALRRAEAAFPVAQQDNNVALRTGHDEIRLAILVDIANDQIVGPTGHGDWGARRRLEERAQDSGRAPLRRGLIALRGWLYVPVFPFRLRFRFHDGNFEGYRYDVAVLPIGEGQGNLSLALACFVRDPHGAVELTASAPLVEHNRAGNRPSLGVLAWKFNGGYGMDVGRDALTMVQVDRGVSLRCRTWRCNPGVDLAARVAAPQDLLIGIAHG